jgi:hypothetical protein
VSRRTTTRAEVRISFGGATFWLSTIVPQGWGDLRHKTRTNGAWEASWAIPPHPRNRNWRHPALVYGARVDVMFGPVAMWPGALGEPDWDSGQFVAIGAARDGETAMALDGAGNASTAPNTVIDAAIARGVLSWTRVGDFGTTPVGDATSGLVTVQSVLDAWAQKNGSRWKVNRQRQLVIEPVDETNPKWSITPGSGSLGTADEDRVDRVFVRFTNSTTGARDMASYPTTTPVGGIEKPKDLIVNRAPMTSAAAQAEAQAIWSELAGRSGFTSGWTLTRGQVTAKGGPIADLAFIEAGDAVCALGASDPRGVALNTNVVLGETDYQWAEDELQANPVGTAARDTEAVLEQVGNLAVSALAAASADRSGDTGWIDVVFQNGWSNFDARTVQYRRRNGEVWMRGIAKNGTVGGGAIAFTLPAGFRPPARVSNDDYFASVGNGAHASISVNGDGAVRVETGSNVYVTFDNVRFLVD